MNGLIIILHLLKNQNYKKMYDKFAWLEGIACSVTVCNKSGIVQYMNPKAAETFNKWGGIDLIGKSLFDCHSSSSRQKILSLMDKGETNCYTIEKRGIKKLIFQTPWFNEDGVQGLVELSFEIPIDMQHFIRE